MAVLSFRTFIAGIFAANLACVSSSFAMQGEPVSEGDLAASSIVLILIENKHTCTGVVFGKNKILTAAHCVTRYGGKTLKPESLKVYYTRNLYSDAHSVNAVSKISSYPGYLPQKKNRDGYEPATPGTADVAILWVKEPHPSRAKDVIIGDSDKEITSSIPRQIKIDKPPSVVAYGFGPENRKFNGVLRKGRMIIDLSLGFTDSFGTQRLIGAALSSTRRVGVCGGDSGGGVFFRDDKTGGVRTREGRPILAGIIFAKRGQGRCASEERMLNSGSFHDWVNSKREN